MTEPSSSAAILHGSFDFRLVALSVVLAISAAYTALDLTGRVIEERRWARVLWLAGGSTSLGLGIWSMHYIGMLAFSLPVPILYHYPTVIVSLLAAIGASAVALLTVSHERLGMIHKVTASLIMGGGIAAMHYIGMDAMRLPATMEHRWGLVSLSVLLAVAISFVALTLSLRIRLKKQAGWRKFGAALLMGSAIPLMHYTGMWAVRFRATGVAFSNESTVQISTLGIVVISVTSFLVMFSAMATVFLDRMISVQNAAMHVARDGEARFRMLAEAIPQIVWTSLPTGEIEYCNERLYDLTGISKDEEDLRTAWCDVLHPDDRPVAIASWEKALATGEPFNMEYRIRTAAGEYRWHLARATPMRDSAGNILRWFGACADIEDQINTQQVLEEQIKARASELADASNRLQEEMWEKDLARRQLDEQNEKMVREADRALATRHDAGQNGRASPELPEQRRSIRRGPGLCSENFSCPARRRGPAQSAGANLRKWRDIGATASCRSPCLSPASCWALRTGQPHLVVAGDSTARCAHARGREEYLSVYSDPRPGGSAWHPACAGDG